jgi:hypothetical protein
MSVSSRMNQPIDLRWEQALLPCRWLATILLFVLAGFGVAGAPSDSTSTISPSAARNTVAKSPWQRIVMLGASATAGFNAAEPLGGSNAPLYDLSRYVDAALKVPHEPVHNLGNAFFFFQPQLFAQQQLTQALTNKPTLIIGVDFLFWFCYGEGRTDEDRLQRFGQGLKLLEKVDCPLVVGDIPDASAAVNGMLRPDQMPSLKVIASANLRLKEWAAGRRQVAIVGLSEFMRNAMANRAITIHAYVLPAGNTRVLLQNDKLHASPPGCAVLALAVLDAFQSTRHGIHAEEVCRDPKEISRRVSKYPKVTSIDAVKTNSLPHD